MARSTFVKSLQDAGCPKDIINDILDCRVDNLMEKQRGSSFWLPMAFELSRAHQKGMKNLVEVLNWIVPVCSHPVKSVEQMFDIILKSGRKFDEYTADLFIDDAVSSAVSRGLFIKLPVADVNQIQINAYKVYRKFAASGNKAMTVEAVSSAAYGDRFHIDQAEKIFNLWQKLGLVDKVSGRDNLRYITCAAEPMLACMEAVGDKYNAFTTNWQHSVRKCWLEGLALQLVMDAENGKILLAMEKVKKTAPGKKKKTEKKATPETKWHPIDIPEEEEPMDIYQQTEPDPKPEPEPEPEPEKLPETKEEDFSFSDDEEVHPSEEIKDSDDMETSIYILELVLQKYSEGYHRSPEGKKKLADLTRAASILMEF